MRSSIGFPEVFSMVALWLWESGKESVLLRLMDERVDGENASPIDQREYHRQFVKSRVDIL